MDVHNTGMLWLNKPIIADGSINLSPFWVDSLNGDVLSLNGDVLGKILVLSILHLNSHTYRGAATFQPVTPSFHLLAREGSLLFVQDAPLDPLVRALCQQLPDPLQPLFSPPTPHATD